METKNKIIIAILVIVIIILSGAIISTTLFKEETKTVELFENGTTIKVPLNTTLEDKTELGITYTTDKKTMILGIDTNDFAGALVSKILSNVIVENGEKQDNGLYKLDKKSIMSIGDQLGFGYDENNISDESFVGIKHNETINQSIFIIGIDEQEILNIIDSIQWKQGTHTYSNNNTAHNTFSSTPSAGKTSSDSDDLMSTYDTSDSYDPTYDDDYYYDDSDVEYGGENSYGYEEEYIIN